MLFLYFTKGQDITKDRGKKMNGFKDMCYFNFIYT